MIPDATYWRECYAEPELMDGVFNAEDHAAYLDRIFALEGVSVRSMVDLGFGLGHLTDAMIAALRPYEVEATEPSAWARERALARGLGRARALGRPARPRIRDLDLLTWCQEPARPVPFDLGVCTSVLHYLADDELATVLPALALRVRYLYLTLPTAVDLERQVRAEGFFDRHAHARTRERWWELLGPHFVCVANRLLESRPLRDPDSVAFEDDLFRF
ncbi:MAG: class I SAM-dependent methyltransferase [Deltaproteobacteria bacterium]|nr:class I SAM-dependent methyltransferase [Deltaproteobacteria bacterium]